MEQFLMPISEVAQILHYDGERAIRRTHDWLLNRGVKQYKRGGWYSRNVINEVLRREEARCISEKEVKSTTYLGKSELEKIRLKSKNTVRDLLHSKMQESMQVV